MDLVIVESPSKTKTIGKYLGSNYKVVSSKGHVRDLATSGKFGLGVDIDNDFAPNYIAITGKKKVISELKKDAKEANKVYLATDPDREGEAISWHLFDSMELKDDNYDRVVFNEITEGAIKEAFKHPRKIDYALVRSQETRRILDRIIGFRLSKLMQNKTGGKSAGRVQSVALKLIVDREREIAAFVPVEYWTIETQFASFKATLEKFKNDKLEIQTEDEANKILSSLSDKYKVIEVNKKEKNKKGVMPFTTSTLQQACSIKYGFSSTKTMTIAQKLYEGIDIGTETVGLISYMRTDSTRLSNDFISSTFGYIKANYGEEYIGNVKQSKKTENIQDAHEAIRPTSINRLPKDMKQYLTPDEYKIYSYIYNRALASLMKDAKVLATTILLNNNDYIFKTNGQIIIFDGYLKVYGDYQSSEDVTLPEINNNDLFISDDIESIQHFTKPEPRYTEASLIKEMEQLGIGRPSTYAKTIDTLKKREYVIIEEKKFLPTTIGIETTDKLQEFFSNIINVKYTANMETDLDKIALNELDNIKVLKLFYKDFEPLVKNAFDSMEKVEPTKTGETCPECGSDLLLRRGKYGEFIACSNYPECKYVKNKEQDIICTCPICDTGNMVLKKTKKKKIFYGCSNFPKCKTAVWDKPTGDLCPECNNLLIEKNKTIKCSSCSYTKKGE